MSFLAHHQYKNLKGGKGKMWPHFFRLSSWYIDYFAALASSTEGKVNTIITPTALTHSLKQN